MKKFTELKTDDEIEAAIIECGNLCLEAIQKYRHEDESWKEEIQKLKSMLHTEFGYNRFTFTIEKLDLYERTVVDLIGMGIVMKALEE